MDDAVLIFLPVLAIVGCLFLCQTAPTGNSDNANRGDEKKNGRQQQLTDYIEYYEPLNYDTDILRRDHHRVKRSNDQQLQLTMHAYRRAFRIRLKRDLSVYSEDLVVETNRGPVAFDTSRAYRGHLEGEEGDSSVYGIVTVDGLFEGRIDSGGDQYSVERATKYFRSPVAAPALFHSVIYHLSSVRMDRLNSSLCRSRQLHSKLQQQQLQQQQQMQQLQRTTANATSISDNTDNRRSPRLRRSGWLLSPAADDDDDGIYPWTRLNDVGDGGDLFRGERFVYRPPASSLAAPPPPSSPHQRPAIDREKTTCTMYIQADHLFYEKFDSSDDTVVEQLTQHVQGVNEIYRRIDFDGNSSPDNINFIIKRIKVWTNPRTSGYKFSGNYGVETFLELLSEENFDSFCLAYMFTYRDFDGGTLGLAWTGDLQNAGGVCEKHGQYRGSSKSLNSGIVTILNYGKDVPPSVSHVTMAHEIGHNIGSQHDPETAECSPGGSDGNYIMYARATSGDRPNNNRFSRCSTQSMAQVISAKAQGEHGCFVPATSAICGNGVVEEGEECDCGWEDECEEKCCYPQTSAEGLGVTCTRRPAAECSPSEGPCCSEDCQLMGRLPSDKQVCREPTKCKTASFCNGTSAVCPSSIHLPNKTKCDDDAVCFHGECSGSLCLAYDLESCQCPPFRPGDFKDPTLCRLCCKEPGAGKPCRSSFQWNRDPYNVPDLNLKPGAACYDYRGYCDVFLKCREIDPTGPLANLKHLIFSAEGIRNIGHWFSVYWYIPSVVATSLFAFLAILIKLCSTTTTAPGLPRTSDHPVRSGSGGLEPKTVPDLATKQPLPPPPSSSVQPWIKRRPKWMGSAVRGASVASVRTSIQDHGAVVGVTVGPGKDGQRGGKTGREFASWV